MITDIPTSVDFEEAAGQFLHSAWGQVCELLIEFGELGEFNYEMGDDGLGISDFDRYWGAAKQTVTTAFALVQQAVEFYIKARISSVSPYLLVSGNPSSWPRKCDARDTPFADFRTVDAQDLIRLHDTVYTERFTEEFRNWYGTMRISRNRILHTIDKKSAILPEEILEAILYAHQYFCGHKRWIASRFEYLDKTPVNSIGYIREHDEHRPYITVQVHTEMAAATDKLKPGKLKLYFDYNKRKRAFKCPNCYEMMAKMDYFDPGYHDELFMPYQELEKGTYSCCVCEYRGVSSGGRCENDGCKSNLVDQEKSICLVCGSS